MTGRRFRYLVISLLLLCSQKLCSQQYNIRLFYTKNGLVNSSVNQIFLDSRGYLWFATQGGLSRFDGKNFKNYTSKEGLPGNNLTSICEDKAGNLWIASFGSGLAKFNGYSFELFSRPEGLKNLEINSIFCDSKSQIWLASAGGIAVFDGKRFKTLTMDDGLPWNEFFCVQEDKDQRMWFGSKRHGLVRYDGKSFITYTRKDGLSDDNIYCMRSDSKGRLWIGTASGGVSLYDGNSFHAVQLPAIDKSLVYAIRQDQHENMWFATEKGLCKLDAMGHSALYTEKNGLNSNDLYALCEDYEGNIWTGSALGASMLKNESFVTYTDKEGLLNMKVNACLEDDQGNFLIASEGSGISMLDSKGKITPLKIKELENAKVLTLFEDSRQHVWVGLESNDKNPLLVLKRTNGIYGVEKKFSDLNNTKVSTVSHILEDKTGNIWVSSFGYGAFMIKGDQVIQYKDSVNVRSVNIFTMFRDSKDNIWFGTFEQGAICYDGKNFRQYCKKDGLGDNWIWTICEDRKGNLYFGTNEGGVSRFDGKGFRIISSREGLVSDLIYALATDSKNRLWIGTDKGMHRLSLDENFHILSSKYYGEQEGLRGTEVSQNGFLYDKEGDLWISTTNGLTRFKAKFDYVNSAPPRMVLNTIRLFYQDVDWSKYTDKIDSVTKLPVTLSLGHKDNHLTFEYQALTTANVKYAFRLDGVDADWSPLTSNTEAVYTNIPSGDNFVFRVKAINPDGFWSKELVSCTFSIRPPFWKTWWFYTISVLIILGSVIVFIRWRTAKLEIEKKILEEKVKERTVELKGANDQLSLAFNDIKDSINYARRIQQAILPLENEIKKELPEHFIYFRPRDVVSGDFYWFNKKNDTLFIAACDCTGHGVPGAFMSIIGNSLLNEIAHETSVSEPAFILNMLREKIIFALKQHTGEQESKDGMDMVLCSIDRKRNKLVFAGANNPLYLIQNGELKEFKGNKQPIGVYGDVLKPFTSTEIDIARGDLIYLFSDGYPDQFGGPKGKKFLYTRFKELLVSVSKKDMEQQHTELDQIFHSWKGSLEQVDDVLVIGIRI
ncbi:MAG: two-component regulator propeller domain-containing protein [Bacteroidia bacterium]